jgi:hypothetical protein
VLCVAGIGTICALAHGFGSRGWALPCLALTGLGAAILAAPWGTRLHWALAYGGIAATAVTVPYWILLPPLVDAGPKGIRVRGGRRIPWGEVEGVDADHDALRIRVRDGPPVYVTTLELPWRVRPVSVALRLDRIQDLSAAAS